MTDQTLLIGTLLRGDLNISDAFCMAAELTELFNQHNLISKKGQREASLHFLQIAESGQLAIVPGVRLYPVQISAIGLALAGALLGSPVLAPFPGEMVAHAAWREDLLVAVSERLADLDEESQARAVRLLEGTLGWDPTWHPEPAFFYRTCLQLAALTTHHEPVIEPSVAQTVDFVPLPTTPPRPSSSRAMALGAALVASIMLLIPLKGSTTEEARAQLTLIAEPDVSIMVDGVETGAAHVVLSTGRHQVLLQDGRQLLSSSFDLTEDTTCTWQATSDKPWSCTPGTILRGRTSTGS